MKERINERKNKRVNQFKKEEDIKNNNKKLFNFFQFNQNKIIGLQKLN